MKIILFEDFKADPLAVVQSLYRYLGVEDHFKPITTRRYNPAGVPKNKFAGSFARGLNNVRNHRYFRMIKPLFPETVRAWNETLRRAVLRKPDPMPEDLAHGLKLYYKDDVLELQEMLKIDLTSWDIV
jgi:hypothetical protein